MYAVEGLSRSMRYARAFLNVFYSGTIPDNFSQNLSSLLDFLGKHPFFFAILSSSVVTKKESKKLLTKLVEQFNIDDCMVKLLSSIIDCGDALFVPLVLQALIKEVLHRRSEELCEIASSHPLTEQERKNMQHLFSQGVNRKLIPRFLVTPSLICGIRAKGETFIWEKSVARRLALVDRAIERGGKA